MNRDRLLDDLRWLAEGNPRYAGLSYIDDREVTELFNGVRKGYLP